MALQRTDNLIRRDDNIVPFRQELSADRQAYFKQVFELHHDALHRFVQRLGADDSEDVVQEVYLRIVRQNEPQKLKQAPRSYLYTIATNIVRDQIRRKRRQMSDQHTSLESQELASTQQSPDDRADMQQRLEIFRRALTELPEKKQKVLILNRFHDMSCRKIAEYLNIPSRSVQRYLSEALAYCQSKVRHHSD